jgi:hypothetical protein
MEVLEEKSRRKNGVTIKCEKCSFSCKRKWDWNIHIKTAKHLAPLFGNKMETNHGENTAFNGILGEIQKYVCECGKKYTTHSGLWKHKHNSKNEVCNNQIDQPPNNDIIKYLMNENKELKNMIMEICKKESIHQNNTTNNNTINQTNNNNNKTFNLQFFLNETCKDAMNISEFIENISLQLSDLESIGKLGYVEGIANIIIKNLKALNVERRPMHCSDVKREIMYVKDDDKWEKEEDDKQKIKQVISSVVSKNLGLLPEFQKKYPDCMKSDSKKSDEYNLIIMETMGGLPGNGEKNKEKIIKKIAKLVAIDKDKE